MKFMDLSGESEFESALSEQITSKSILRTRQILLKYYWMFEKKIIPLKFWKMHFHIVSETPMLRNHYFSGFLREKFAIYLA